MTAVPSIDLTVLVTSTSLDPRPARMLRQMLPDVRGGVDDARTPTPRCGAGHQRSAAHRTNSRNG